MMYYVSIVKGGGFMTTVNAYPRDEAITIAKQHIKQPCVNFGDGFWTRSVVYLGRIVAMENKK